MTNGDITEPMQERPVAEIRTIDIYNKLLEMDIRLQDLRADHREAEIRRGYEQKQMHDKQLEIERDLQAAETESEQEFASVRARLASLEQRLYAIPALSSLVGLAGLGRSAFSILAK